MKHEERWALARSLCKRIAQQAGKSFVLGGVYGSTARETDTEWSDLELFFVVEGIDDRSFHLLAGDIPVGFRVMGSKTLEDELAHPSPRWPFLLGVLSGLRVLEGHSHHVEDWLRLGKSVPPERFREALERALPGLVWESYGRILSCQIRGNSRDLLPSVLEVLSEMRTALCLLNASWVTHDYFQGLADTFGFAKLPRDFPALATALWEARDPEEIGLLATRLVSNFKQLLSDEGIRLLTVDELDMRNEQR